ncbi:hypothetical protein B0H14DRAFT_2598477 [Mycena olivaceomarginata]|nr:hypothetical protein B0H14DRAFT_2598477 [Mycena olivaceomarginata]
MNSLEGSMVKDEHNGDTMLPRVLNIIQIRTLCTHPDVQHHLNNSGPSLIPTGSLAPEDVGTAQAVQQEVGAMKVPAHDRGMRRGSGGVHEGKRVHELWRGVRAAAGCACNGGTGSSYGGVRMQRRGAIARSRAAGYARNGGAQSRGGGVRTQRRGVIEGRHGTHATAGRDRAATGDAFRAEEQRGASNGGLGSRARRDTYGVAGAGAAAERASGHGRMCGGVREQRWARTSVVLCAERLQEVAGCQRWRRSKSATEARKQEAKAQRTGFKNYETCLAAHWPIRASSAANGAVAVEGEASKEQSNPTSLMYSNTKQSCFIWHFENTFASFLCFSGLQNLLICVKQYTLGFGGAARNPGPTKYLFGQGGQGTATRPATAGSNERAREYTGIPPNSFVLGDRESE